MSRKEKESSSALDKTVLADYIGNGMFRHSKGLFIATHVDGLVVDCLCSGGPKDGQHVQMRVIDPFQLEDIKKINRMKFVCLDTETGGYSSEKNALVQIGMVLAVNNDIVREAEFCIQPYGDYYVTKEARAVHGITHDQWLAGETLDYASGLMKDTLEWADVVVGHNLDFDLKFLAQMFSQPAAHYYDVKTCNKECTLKLSRAKLKGLQVGGSLAKVCAHFGVENDNEHTALSDARATWEVYRHLKGM